MRVVGSERWRAVVLLRRLLQTWRSAPWQNSVSPSKLCVLRPKQGTSAFLHILLNLGLEVKIPGKVFGGSALGATGAEFSFQSFQPGTETGFLHKHHAHEELYFFLSGKGEFQVDGKVFPVAEGTVVRVAPKGVRTVRNNGDVALVMLCVQYKAGTFTSADAADGEILQTPVEW